MSKPKQILLVGALSLLAGAAIAQDQGPVLGTTSADVPSARVKGPVAPSIAASEAAGPVSFRYSKAQYGTGGVSFRNRRSAVIHISGVLKPVQAAFLYWAYLFGAGQNPPPQQTVEVTRLTPTASGLHTITGSLIATGGDPCWGSAGIAVYRARLGTNLANGNGAYLVNLGKNQSALNTGEDPWNGNVVFPAGEGASMVIVGTGPYTVGIYDTQIPSGTTFSGAYTYTLALPLQASGGQALWDTFGADGQIGSSRLAFLTGETTTINGVQVSGPGGTNQDSDWDGSSGWPLPQLWDDTGHDITTAVPAGTTKLVIRIDSHGDCISTVGNVVAQQ
jgi:hypothetical protein